MKKLKVILISCLCLLMMTGCTTNKIDNQKIKIVCTTYVQYDWLQQIIGKENSTFDLSLIIKNGVDLHNYQPTVQDIVQKFLFSNIRIYSSFFLLFKPLFYFPLYYIFRL